MSNPAIEDTATYADLVGHHGDELAQAVAVIAEADGPLVVHGPAGEHHTGLVLALALLAAGLPTTRHCPRRFRQSRIRPPCGMPSPPSRGTAEPRRTCSGTV